MITQRNFSLTDEQLWELAKSGDKAAFEAPFFVPLPKDAPDGITLRVVAADPSSGSFGVAEAKYPVLSERLPPKRSSP